MSSTDDIPKRPARRQKVVFNMPTENKEALEKLSFGTVSMAAKEESKWKRTAIFKRNKPLRDTSPIYIPSRLAFLILALFSCVAAIYSPILDCDEVFNYWEPTHYLNHGHGFQTWEYSPQYAIRSWAYAGLHAFLTLPGRLVPGPSRAYEFYTLRVLLGLGCAFSQTYMYTKISRIISPKIGSYLLLVFVSSPGFFHSSVAYLPSSFAMYATAMAVADFVDWRGGARTAEGIFWFGLATFFAWPFVGILVLPFLAEEILLGSYTSTLPDVGTRFLYGVSRTTLVGVVVFFIDLAFYRKYVCVAFNLVVYNVLAATKGSGPAIFGTEPRHFYIRNLLINFHLWFVLAVLALPAIIYQEFWLHKPCNRMGYIRNVTVATPLYIWLAIFTLQPHKEERFMYPAYPLMAINAAITIHLALMWLGQAKPRSGFMGKLSAQAKLGLVSGLLITCLAVAVLRIVGLVTAYAAPLKIYRPLHKVGMATQGDTVCHGKEWYRFPSHYHLPKGVNAKFVRSEFSGLLPGEFSQAGTGFGIFPGAWLVPPGMNNENREDAGKHMELRHCTFMIDSFLPSTRATELEPDHVNDTDKWHKVYCEPFLDAKRTGVLGRLFWIPEHRWIPQRFYRQWGEVCLLKSNQKPTSV